jgi:FG-GAP repeat
VITSAPGPTAPSGWTVAGAADFNGDGQPDLLFFHPGSLQTYIWYMKGLTPTGSAPGPTLPAGWSLAAP